MYIVIAAPDFRDVDSVDVTVVSNFPVEVYGMDENEDTGEIEINNLEELAKWATWRCGGFTDCWKIEEYVDGKYVKTIKAGDVQ